MEKHRRERRRKTLWCFSLFLLLLSFPFYLWQAKGPILSPCDAPFSTAAHFESVSRLLSFVVIG